MKTNLHTLKKLRAASCYSVHTLKHLIPSYQIWTLVVPGSDPHLISWSDSSSFSVGASQPLTIINMENNNGGGGGSTERRRRLVDVYEEASCLLLIFFMCVFSCLGDASLNTTSELSVNVKRGHASSSAWGAVLYSYLRYNSETSDWTLKTSSVMILFIHERLYWFNFFPEVCNYELNRNQHIRSLSPLIRDTPGRTAAWVWGSHDVMMSWVLQVFGRKRSSRCRDDYHSEHDEIWSECLNSVQKSSLIKVSVKFYFENLWFFFFPDGGGGI